MLIAQKEKIAELIGTALAEALAASGAPALALPAIELERPRQAGHGDLSCSVAMQLARKAGIAPRTLAESLAEALRRVDTEGLIESVAVAGPGFLNLQVSASAKLAVVAEVFAQGRRFGRGTSGAGRKAIVEFVSANPTGPLHVGHGRQAALGDSLADLLEACGWQVSREFYYNDAGAQIANLARSVQARARGIEPDDERFPADGYRGDYIREIALEYLAGGTVAARERAPVHAVADPDDLDAIRHFAVAWLRHEQDLDLRAFGVRFDHFYLESSLYNDGRVERTVAALRAAGHTFEEGGALWLRTTGYGDDKDRVMRKSDGAYTYFVPDVAYHVTKWERGFEKAINIQGSDHHGTISRVRAGLQALDRGIPVGYPDYVLHKMVTVMRGGEEVKISKRAGSYVTLRDLITWSGEQRDADGAVTDVDERRGRDAVRFFLVSRRADSEFVFDVDLALARTDANPVYYVQYAHARICSVLAQWAAARGESSGPKPETLRSLASVDLAPLTSKYEFALAARLAAYPELIEGAAADLAPYAVPFYLKDLAADLHAYYNAERFLVEDEALRRARIALLVATRQVLRNGLELIGVSAPERM